MLYDMRTKARKIPCLLLLNCLVHQYVNTSIIIFNCMLYEVYVYNLFIRFISCWYLVLIFYRERGMVSRFFFVFFFRFIVCIESIRKRLNYITILESCSQQSSCDVCWIYKELYLVKFGQIWSNWGRI